MASNSSDPKPFEPLWNVTDFSGKTFAGSSFLDIKICGYFFFLSFMIVKEEYLDFGWLVKCSNLKFSGHFVD